MLGSIPEFQAAVLKGLKKRSPPSEHCFMLKWASIPTPVALNEANFAAFQTALRSPSEKGFSVGVVSTDACMQTVPLLLLGLPGDGPTGRELEAQTEIELDIRVRVDVGAIFDLVHVPASSRDKFVVELCTSAGTKAPGSDLSGVVLQSIHVRPRQACHVALYVVSDMEQDIRALETLGTQHVGGREVLAGPIAVQLDPTQAFAEQVAACYAAVGLPAPEDDSIMVLHDADWMDEEWDPETVELGKHVAVEVEEVPHAMPLPDPLCVWGGETVALARPTIALPRHQG